MLPDINFDFVKSASQMFIIDYIVSVTLVNNELVLHYSRPWSCYHGLVVSQWKLYYIRQADDLR